MWLTHDCVALFPHERNVKGVGKVSNSRLYHIDWSETGEGLATSFTPPLAVALVHHFFVALITQTRGIEQTICVLDLGHVAVDEKYMTLIGIILLSDKSIDFTDQVKVACFFNCVFAKQRLLLTSAVALSRLLCQVLKVQDVILSSLLQV